MSCINTFAGTEIQRQIDLILIEENLYKLDKKVRRVGYESDVSEGIFYEIFYRVRSSMNRNFVLLI